MMAGQRVVVQETAESIGGKIVVSPVVITESGMQAASSLTYRAEELYSTMNAFEFGSNGVSVLRSGDQVLGGQGGRRAANLPDSPYEEIETVVSGSHRAANQRGASSESENLSDGRLCRCPDSGGVDGEEERLQV
jgi:hypothetical protein